MKKISIGIAGFGVLSAVALGLAGPAAAAGADDAINGLRSDGYTIQLNGAQSANLSQCTVLNVKKDPLGGAAPTAYVEIACPTGC